MYSSYYHKAGKLWPYAGAVPEGQSVCSVPFLLTHSADLRSFCGRGVTGAIRQACAVKRYLKAESSPVGQIEFYVEPWDLW